MPSLVETVKTVIENHPIQDKEAVERYEEGIRMFNELVKRGVLKPRGYQLAGIDDNIKECPCNQSLFDNVITRE